MGAVKVMVVDSDHAVVEAIKGQLAKSGFATISAYTAQDGILKFQQNLPSAIILRYSLPDKGGWQVAQRVREISDTPILFFSELGDRLSIERALAIGDEYMTRPWNWERLSAKLTVLLKRYGAKREETLLYDDGRLQIDVTNRRTTKSGKPVHLTDTEFRLLGYFVRKANRILGYDELITHMWGRADSGAKAYLSRYVGFLRRRIEDDPLSPVYLLTARGVGYWFRSHERPLR
ncbi:MAG TPA: response regulator transcription factor [Anaerolineales bacterium]|nr:response regulator transcription factor [Anaerolineales bacterium]